MKTSTVSVKRQVVIPFKLRHKYGIKKGTRIYGEICMVPVTHDFIDLNIGFLGTKGKLRRALAAEKKGE